MSYDDEISQEEFRQEAEYIMLIEQHEKKLLEQNKVALEQFKQSFPDINTAFEMKPRDASNYLFTILKFVCAGCGKNKVTASNLKFNNFQPDTKCWECQQK